MNTTDVILHNETNEPSTSNESPITKIINNDEVDYILNEDFRLDAKHLNRVHEELEKLNIATDVINKLELQLDEARATFRKIQASWSQKLNELSRKYGSAIAKGRPYYEAKLKERQLREEAQNAAIRFERANSLHTVAKQQVKLTQDSLNRQRTIEPECLEVLNHHIQRVNEAEQERIAAEEMHRSVSERMTQLAKEIAQLQDGNTRAIKKSRHYFEQRIEFTRILDYQKSLILKLESEVRQKKYDYTSSLRNLEQISDAIHEERSLSSVRREPGVGCESPDLPSCELSFSKENRIEEEKERRRKADIANTIALEGIKVAFDQLTLDCDKAIDPALFDDSPEGTDSGALKDGTLSSGVILLAQQLILNQNKSKPRNKNIRLSADLTDFRYRTELPEGAAAAVTISLPDGSDSDSSLESSHTGVTMNTDDLSGMLRSHSEMIEEIDECAQRTETILHNNLNVIRGISNDDGERDSGHSSSSY
uniref:SH3 domain-binding protein 5 homolog n=1 Tax=Onchocerca volvulus TaxID=6282 RepID=A0A8R1XV26_ONCVO